MQPRKIKDGVFWLGAVDWDRRLFDSLVELPDGTSYNAYLVRGRKKTALLDTVDPRMTGGFMEQLESVKELDYVISHHAEQDHTGSIPAVLEKYKNAAVVCSTKAKSMLLDLLDLPEERITTVNDGDTLDLGGKTLRFLYTPWVHWPETMVTYLREDRILFSCDFFGSHLATSELYATQEARVYAGAKMYYAEIMMPFRAMIQKNLEKIKTYEFDLIAPSHGPIYDKPQAILAEYHQWVDEMPRNIVVVPYVSMHDSTKKMVEHLVGGLTEREITVLQFELTSTDIGKLATALVDAATVVFGTPVVLAGPHPQVVYAAYLANALRPKLKFASIIGSYGWGSKLTEQIGGLIPNLKVEILDPVYCKGLPRAADFAALDRLADAIAQKHRDLQLR